MGHRRSPASDRCGHRSGWSDRCLFDRGLGASLSGYRCGGSVQGASPRRRDTGNPRRARCRRIAIACCCGHQLDIRRMLGLRDDAQRHSGATAPGSCYCIDLSCSRHCATVVQRAAGEAALTSRDQLPEVKPDPGFPGLASRRSCGFQLEGLAVAIPWGFESPLSHHSQKKGPRNRALFAFPLRK